MSSPGSKWRKGSRVLPLLSPKALVLLLSGSLLGGKGGIGAQAQILSGNATPEGQRCSIGQLGTRCPSGYFCLFQATGSCGGFNTAPGSCSRFPEACPTTRQPVCACDGNTYANDCHAHAAGLSIKSLGECPASRLGSIFGFPFPFTAPAPAPPVANPVILNPYAGTLKPPAPAPAPAPAPPAIKTAAPTRRPTPKPTPKPTPAPPPHPKPPSPSPSPVNTDHSSNNDYDDVFKLPGDKSLLATSSTSSIGGSGDSPPKAKGGVSLFGRSGSLFGGKTSVFMDRLSNKATACTSSSMCGSGQFCRFPLSAPNTNTNTYTNINSLTEDACPTTFLSLTDKQHNTQSSNVLGTCESRPEACIEIYKPVCGCDGKTYSNDCVAHQSGMSVRHSGPCASPAKPDNKPKPPTNKTSCGGFRGVGCGEGLYCNFQDHSCGAADQTGLCEAVGSGRCPKVLMPVCGCDGVTYSSACVAAAKGVSLADKHKACPVPSTEACGGDAGSCEDKGHFCQYTMGVCGRYKQQGLCAARPTHCSSTVLPVCGCDGVTYKNGCFATLSGVSVAVMGECPALASGGSNGPTLPILKTLLLQDSNSTSGKKKEDEGVGGERREGSGRVNQSAAVAMAFFGDTSSSHRDKQKQTAFQAQPTNAATDPSLDSEASSALAYANSMLQLMAQAGGSNDTCGSGLGSCPAGFYCVYPEGTCGQQPRTAGVCMSVPTACESFAPLEVCGCDGVTYPSQCHAAANKIPVRSPFQSCQALRASTQAGTTSPASSLTAHSSSHALSTLLAAVAMGLALAGGLGAY